MRTNIKICHANEFCDNRWHVVDSFDGEYTTQYLGNITPQIEEYLSSPNFELQDGLIVRCESKDEIPCTLVYFNDEFHDVGGWSRITRNYYTWNNEGRVVFALDGLSWPEAWCRCDDPYTMMETLAKVAPIQRIVLICVELIRASTSNLNVSSLIALSTASEWAVGNSTLRYTIIEYWHASIQYLFEIINDKSRLSSNLRLVLLNSIGRRVMKRMIFIIRKNYSLHDTLIDLVSR